MASSAFSERSDTEGAHCRICHPKGVGGQPPRIFINTRWQSVHELKQSLNLTPSQAAHFDVLNRHLFYPHMMAFPGDLVVIGDPAAACELHFRQQLKHADHVHRTLEQHRAPTDDFLLNNYALINQLFGYASLGAGVASDGWSRHLQGVAQTLTDIDLLHRTSLGPSKANDRDAFYRQRAVLFKRLDHQLSGLGRIATQLQHDTNTKRMLGISTRSYLAKGVIDGYAERIVGVTKAANLMKQGTYIGMAISTMSTMLDIRQACMTGREEACRKAKVVEATKLGASLTIGALGGVAGGKLGTVVCVALGLPTASAGALACAAVVGGITSYASSKIGPKVGEPVGELIYEVTLQ